MREQKTWVVITTINKPTEAIEVIAKLAMIRNWEIVVIGDTKTPIDWSYDEITYLSVDKQVELYGKLAKQIPLKHYCRKNLGYLYAIQNGADIILETDDDNIPYEDFGSFTSQLQTLKVVTGSKWINIYKYFTKELIWPRGLNLEKIHEYGVLKNEEPVKSSVHQFLADDDPDVDAIYRLIFKNAVKFDPNSESIAVDEGCFVPFNSQNTIFYKDSFPLLYLPCFVSFRMTDIWRSFVVQRYLWSIDEKLIFHKATVKQIRNEHSLIKDFKDEIDGYLQNELIVTTLSGVDLNGLDANAKMFKLWKSLYDVNIINADEMSIIESWLTYFN